MVHGSTYTVWARGLSSDAGVGVGGSSVSIIIDNKDPATEGTLSITAFNAANKINNFTTLNGLVEDPTSGVNAGTVTLKLIDQGLITGGVPAGPNLYWNGSNFTANSTNYVQMTGAMQPADNPGPNAPTAWAYTGISNGNFTNGHQYQAQVQAADAVGNLSALTPGTPFQFIYDTQAPTSTLTVPQVDLSANTTNTYVTQPLSTISGASLDNTSLAPNVKVKIHDTLNGYLLPSCTGWAAVDPGWITTSNSAQLTLTAGQWKLLTSTYVWTDGHLFEIYSQADDGINTETNVTLKGRFRYDTDLPYSAIVKPPQNASTLAYEQLPALTGTASDVTLGYPQDSGIQSVQIQVFDTISNAYFDPGTGDFTSSSAKWETTTNSTVFVSSVVWTDTTIPAKFKDGYIYRIASRALDRAATNYELVIDTFTFQIDQSTPTIVTTAPVSGDYNQQVTAIYGTWTDGIGSGITAPPVRISRGSDGQYWLGGAWGANPGNTGPPFAVLSGNNWSYPILPAALSTFYNVVPNTFTVILYATDNTVDVPHSTSSVSMSFAYETLPPSTTITSPAQGVHFNKSNNALTQIQGTAIDQPGGLGSGISKVWVQIHYYGPDGIPNNADDLYWNDNAQAWQSGVQFATATLSANATAYWLNFTAANWHSSAGSQYLVMTQAFDNGRMGNAPYTIQGTQEVTPTVIGSPNFHYFIVDTTAPTSAVTLPGTSPIGSLPIVSGTAADVAPGQLTQVQVAYRDVAANKWWDPVAKSFTPGLGTDGYGGSRCNRLIISLCASSAPIR